MRIASEVKSFLTVTLRSCKKCSGQNERPLHSSRALDQAVCSRLLLGIQMYCWEKERTTFQHNNCLFWLFIFLHSITQAFRVRSRPPRTVNYNLLQQAPTCTIWPLQIHVELNVTGCHLTPWRLLIQGMSPFNVLFIWFLRRPIIFINVGFNSTFVESE